MRHLTRSYAGKTTIQDVAFPEGSMCAIQCKYNRSPMHIFVSGCAAPGSWQVPILREGKGSNYTPWRQFLKSVPSPADTTLSSGHRGEEAQPTPDNPRLQDHQQASMLHQLDGCERLPKALRHPDKVCWPLGPLHVVISCACVLKSSRNDRSHPQLLRCFWQT